MIRLVLTAAGLCGCLFTNANAACRADLALSAPNARYAEPGDGLVLDIRTGLVWYKCTIAESYDSATDTCVVTSADLQSLTWQGALQAIGSINDAGLLGFNDWRMPNIKELGSLVERACTDPSINETYFPDAASDLFWSSTPIFRGLEIGFPIDFTDGREVAFPVIENLDANQAGLRTRLVRTP